MIRIKLTNRAPLISQESECTALAIRPKISVKLSERISPKNVLTEIKASEVVATLGSGASQKAAKRIAEDVTNRCMQIADKFKDYASDFGKTPEQFMFLAKTYFDATREALPSTMLGNIKYMIEVRLKESDFDSENDLGLASAAYKKIYLSDPSLVFSEMDLQYFYKARTAAVSAITDVVKSNPKLLTNVIDSDIQYTPQQLINRLTAFYVQTIIDHYDISGRSEDRYQLGQLLKKFINYKPILQPEDSDLNRINSLAQLKDILERYKQKYDVYFRSKLSKDAPGGTESYGTITATVNVKGKPISDQFDIHVAHNKAAACQLGDNTEWCTARFDSNYFKGYYAPDSPLFIFSNKEGTLKYQLVAGIPDKVGKNGEEIAGVEPALKDKEDNPVDDATAHALYSALISIRGVLEKYPSLRRFHN